MDRQENRRHRINWLLASLFIFHLIVGHVAFRGYVLCLGFDGHIAIEASNGQAICTDAKTQSSIPETLPLNGLNYISAGDDCCLCLDFPIGFDCHELAKIQPEKRHPQPLMHALKTSANEYYASPKTEASIANNYCSIPVNLSLISLQTTVLLI